MYVFVCMCVFHVCVCCMYVFVCMCLYVCYIHVWMHSDRSDFDLNRMRVCMYVCFCMYVCISCMYVLYVCVCMYVIFMSGCTAIARILT